MYTQEGKNIKNARTDVIVVVCRSEGIATEVVRLLNNYARAGGMELT